MRSGGWVLLTAISATSPECRPARRAHSSTRSHTVAMFSAIDISLDYEGYASAGFTVTFQEVSPSLRLATRWSGPTVGIRLELRRGVSEIPIKTPCTIFDALRSTAYRQMLPLRCIRTYSLAGVLWISNRNPRPCSCPTLPTTPQAGSTLLARKGHGVREGVV